MKPNDQTEKYRIIALIADNLGDSEWIFIGYCRPVIKRVYKEGRPWRMQAHRYTQGGTVDKILELLKPENLRIPLFLLGVALLGRSLTSVQPEFGVTILGPHEQPQDILMYFNIEVERYIMTMLWPLAFALLNSLHPDLKVTKAFFNLVIGLHICSLVVSLIWYFNYIPNNQEGVSHLAHGLSHMQSYALMIFIASLVSAALSLLWFNKGWTIFQPEPAR